MPFKDSGFHEHDWIGVDLDCTLAEYSGYKGHLHIGEPIPMMVERVKKWILEGEDVRIFTARVAQSIYRPTPEAVFRTVNAIQDWTEKHIGVRLQVTCIKDANMKELWDDRAVQVIPNTGLRVDGED